MEHSRHELDFFSPLSCLVLFTMDKSDRKIIASMSSDVVNDAFSTINERVQKEKEQNEKEEGKERQKNA